MWTSVVFDQQQILRRHQTGREGGVFHRLSPPIEMAFPQITEDPV